MRLQDILSRPMPEMAYANKKAELVITGLEKPINDHLLKLAAVAAHDGQGEGERAPFAEACAHGAMTDREIESLVDRFARGEPVDA